MRYLKLLPLLFISGMAFAGVQVQEGDSPGFGSVTASSMTIMGNGIELPDGTVLTTTATIGGPINSVIAGTGLTGGGTTGNVTLSAVSTTVYTTKINTFVPVQNFNGIDASSVTLSGVGIVFNDGTILTSTAAIGMGTITDVIAGTGLTGGGALGSVTLTASTSTVYNDQTNTFTPNQTFAKVFVSTINIGGSLIELDHNANGDTLSIVPNSSIKGLQIWNSDHTTAIQTVNTLNNRVGFFSANPAGPFEIGTNANVFGALTVGSGLILSQQDPFSFMGQATLVAGAAVVANQVVSSHTQIFLTTEVPNGAVGSVYVSSTTSGTSFNILSTSNTDTSTVGYLIIKNQ